MLYKDNGSSVSARKAARTARGQLRKDLELDQALQEDQGCLILESDPGRRADGGIEELSIRPG